MHGVDDRDGELLFEHGKSSLGGAMQRHEVKQKILGRALTQQIKVHFIMRLRDVLKNKTSFL